MKSLLGQSRGEEVCGEFIIDESVTTDKYVIVEEFNRYFSSVGSELAEAHKEPSDYNVYLRPVSETLKFAFTTATRDEVIGIISNMKDTAVGHDELPLSLFRDNIDVFCETLCLLCNLSMKSGIMPDKMKLARVTCIFKGGDLKRVSNYRPISVLPVLSKLLEKIFCVRLAEYLAANYLIADCQFGFRTHRTTENAVQNIVAQLYGDFDAGRYGFGVFLDLAKHSTLLIELYYMAN